jgi:hypothetical protein
MSEWNQKGSMYFLQVEGVIRWRVIFEVGDTRYEGDPSGCFGSGERWSRLGAGAEERAGEKGPGLSLL